VLRWFEEQFEQARYSLPGFIKGAMMGGMMAGVRNLRINVLAFLLLWGAMENTAHAEENIINRARDGDGLYKEPICDYEFRIQKSLSIMLGEKPSGVTATSNAWEMEIYSNPQDGSWTLVGKSTIPTTSSIKKLCQLAKGLPDRPYVQEVWYRKYFLNAS